MRIIIALLLLTFHVTANYTVSEVNVNLPSTCNHCNIAIMRITASGGEFDWKTTSDRLSIVANEKGSDLIITSNSTISNDNIIYIEATDRLQSTQANFVPRIECKFSNIKKIMIVKKLDRINLYDFATFHVIAYDEHDSQISSVEGFRFVWNITSGSDVVEHINSSEASFDLTPLRKNLERNNEMGDIFIVRSTKIGKAIITVTLNEPFSYLKQVMPAQIEVEVIERFTVQPEYLRLLKHSTYQLQIEKERPNKKKEPVDLYKEHDYIFTSNNNSLFSVTLNGLLETHNLLGESTASIQNSNKSNTVVKEVQVVEPFIKLSLQDITTLNTNLECNTIQSQHWRWTEDKYVVAGHTYVVKLNIVDSANRLIAIPLKSKFGIGSDFQDTFKMIQSCQNYEYFQITILPNAKNFIMKLSFSLNNNQIANKDEMFTVLSQVKIIFPADSVLLPYYISPYPRAEWKLVPQGGSQEYKWESSNENVVTISSEGIIKVQGDRKGECVVKLIDAKCQSNTADIKVEIAKINEISWLEQKIEVEVNTQGIANMMAYASNNRKFTNCSNLKSILTSQFSSSIIESYEAMKKYVTSNIKLIEEIEAYLKMPTKSFELLTYNNYGVCSQYQVSHNSLGLFTGKSLISYSPSDIIVSADINVIFYRPIYSLFPTYEEFLYLLKTNEQDMSYIKRYAPNSINTEFTLAPGSSMNWVVAAGSIQYQQLEAIEEKVESSSIILKANKSNSHDLSKHFIVQCPETFDSITETIKINLASKKSLEFPRPITNTASLKINCRIPESAILTWSRVPNEDNIDITKTMPILNNNTGAYFVPCNTLIGVRTLFYDNENKLFYNHTYKKHDIATTNTNLGIVFPTASPYSYLMSISNTKNLNGSYIIKSTTLIPKGKNHNENIYAELHINAISKLVIKPEFKLLYYSLTNSFEFALIPGSLNYLPIKPSPPIFDFAPMVSQSSVKIMVRDVGFTKLVMEDVMIHSESEATVQISEVEKLVIEDSKILEEQEYGNLLVEAYSIGNKLFEQDQFKLIYTNIKCSANKEGLYISEKETGIQVKGNLPGEYKVTCTVQSALIKGKIVTSNVGVIYVYNFLQLHPAKLLLVPYASYTIGVNGGPSSQTIHVNKRFSIGNPKVATIDDITGEVVAVNLGNTTATYEISSPQGLIISKSIPVEVAVPTNLQIVGLPSLTLFKGATYKVINALKIRKETFTYGVDRNIYNWHPVHYNVLHLKKQADDKNDFAEIKGGNVGVVVNAVDEGESGIIGEATLDLPSNIKASNYLKGQEEIKIIPMLTSEYQTFAAGEQKTDTILLPPNSKHRINSNLKDKYKIEYSTPEKCERTPIADDGTVSVGPHYEGVVKGRVSEKNFDSSEIAFVETREITGVIIINSDQAKRLPLGGEKSFKITYLDQYGRAFASKIEGINVQLENSHPRVVQVSTDYYNSTLYLKALTTGNATILLRSLLNPAIYDVFEVSISSIIMPPSPALVHIGGSVQFNLDRNYSSSKDLKTKWTVSNSSIATINQETGFAEALGIGETGIQLNGTLQLTSSIVVSKVENIVMDSTYDSIKYITNIDSNKFYKNAYTMKFRLFDFKDNEFKLTSTSDSLIRHKINFECFTPNSEWVTVTTDSLDSICKIIPIKSTEPKNPPSEITLEVTAGQQGGLICTKSFKFPFISSFKIIADTTELIMYSNNRSKSFELIGNNDVFVEPEDQNLAVITKANTSHVSYKITVTIPPHVTDPFKMKKLFIKNEKAMQTEILYISFYNEEIPVAPVPTSSGFNIFDILTTLIIVGITTFLFLYVLAPKASVISPRKYKDIQHSNYYSGQGQQYQPSFNSKPSPNSSQLITPVPKRTNEVPHSNVL